MNWQVSTTIYGGPQPTEADLDSFTAIAESLERVAQDLGNMAFAWHSGGEEFSRQAQLMPGCPSSRGFLEAGHTSIDYPALALNAEERRREFTALSDRFRACGEQVVRTYSLYSEADNIATRIISESVQGIYTLPKKYSAPLWASTIGIIGGTIVLGSIREGHKDLSWMSYATSEAQEGLISAAGALIGGNFWERLPGGGAFSTNEVGAGATTIGAWTAKLVNLFQGNELEVKPMHVTKPFLDAPRNIQEAMANLYRLGQERLGKGEGGTGLDYGTIAIQKFRNADGTVNWLVTIPGTDGMLDSPFGWLQNVELMSDDPDMRREADSARMVVEAMRQAGVGKDDAVTMIGHSQGGIVAATVASDFKDDYNIRHIVTCGSPIANHPVPERTWVTSVEDQDELVSNLDGARNPLRDTWLTVRGVTVPGAPDPSDPFASTAVPGAGTGRTLTHEMPYLAAAFANATIQDSKPLKAHESHFDGLIAGTLEETTYYQGRMRHNPGEDLKTAGSLGKQAGQAVIEHKIDQALGPVKEFAKRGIADKITEIGDDIVEGVKERIGEALRSVHGRK
ncbi:alpha/beta fold hydrolase [Bifidobacterium avesanii]|uniref:Alpha/beta fold hydrolase n=1 Tax=Bifidobacterium avesanii TaxID=1798157 RepID=A0A7K3TEX2_9BIFI|nr:alpha/beta fold hydrolase [Bifidobacterium avesanii]KAB8295624.1 hypothetical protein DSM100685_0234 [Bifidobacterium avesanii]NEG77628.1 alpha/beta fold hydrolase [Bifidobacterium avesanii]